MHSTVLKKFKEALKLQHNRILLLASVRFQPCSHLSFYQRAKRKMADPDQGENDSNRWMAVFQGGRNFSLKDLGNQSKNNLKFRRSKENLPESNWLILHQSFHKSSPIFWNCREKKYSPNSSLENSLWIPQINFNGAIAKKSKRKDQQVDWRTGSNEEENRISREHDNKNAGNFEKGPDYNVKIADRGGSKSVLR